MFVIKWLHSNKHKQNATLFLKNVIVTGSSGPFSILFFTQVKLHKWKEMEAQVNTKTKGYAEFNLKSNP